MEADFDVTVGKENTYFVYASAKSSAFEVLNVKFVL